MNTDIKLPVPKEKLTSKEDYFTMIRIADSISRHKDMIGYFRALFASNKEIQLNCEERNLLAVAYKNVTGPIRNNNRILTELLQREYIEPIASLLTTVKTELIDICTEIQEIIDKQCTFSKDPETLVFYKKMKGDYYRYRSEVASENERAEIISQAQTAYEHATDIATALPATNNHKLGLALNYSVFQYEIKNDCDAACRLAKTSFDDAVAQLDTVSDENKDTTLIMQLLRDNFTARCLVDELSY